jgi:DNA-binding transcriptional LysR family regulator
MNPLREIDLFVAVGRARSFTEAAKALGMPTSTLSRRIAELERSLGLQLFVRTTRRVELTEVARRYLAHCETIVEAAEEAQAEILGLAENPSGVLRISLEPDVGAGIVGPVIAECLQRYPKVMVDLDLSPRRVDLIAEGFDLAVRLGSLPDSSLIVRQVTSLSVGLYASPAYLKRHGEPRVPADLRARARLHLLHKHDSGDWLLRSGRQRVVVKKKGATVAANNMSMLRTLLRLGQGIGVMDEVMGAEDVKAGLLRRVMPAWTLPPVAVSVLTPGRLVPAKTRVFIDLMAQRLSAPR